MDTQTPTPTYSRAQLYEKLWSVPATKIAAELGISSAGLVAICKAQNIPRPPTGYWTMLKYGTQPEKPALPPAPDALKQNVVIQPKPPALSPSKPEVKPKYDLDIQAILDRALELEPVVVPDSLHSPHRLIAATKDHLRYWQTPYSERPANPPDSRPTVCIQVENENTSRALRIMDALVKRVEKIGGVVEVKKEKWHKYRNQTMVRFGNEFGTPIRLREKLQRQFVPQDKKKYSFDSDYQLQPNGTLMVDEGPGSLNSVLLIDKPNGAKIEDGLNDLIIKLIHRSGYQRITRIRIEEEARQAAEDERIRREQAETLRKRREDLANRQKKEQAKVDQLIQHANSWHQSKRIRRYLSAICDTLLERDDGIYIKSDAADYLRWGHQQAQRLDPLTPKPWSVLDEKIVE